MILGAMHMKDEMVEEIVGFSRSEDAIAAFRARLDIEQPFV